MLQIRIFLRLDSIVPQQPQHRLTVGHWQLAGVIPTDIGRGFAVDACLKTGERGQIGYLRQLLISWAKEHHLVWDKLPPQDLSQFPGVRGVAVSYDNYLDGGAYLEV